MELEKHRTFHHRGQIELEKYRTLAVSVTREGKNWTGDTQVA